MQSYKLQTLLVDYPGTLLLVFCGRGGGWPVSRDTHIFDSGLVVYLA